MGREVSDENLRGGRHLAPEYFFTKRVPPTALVARKTPSADLRDSSLLHDLCAYDRNSSARIILITGANVKLLGIHQTLVAAIVSRCPRYPIPHVLVMELSDVTTRDNTRLNRSMCSTGPC